MSPKCAPARSARDRVGRAGEKWSQKAAGGVLSAKQGPHRRGLAPALALRAGAPLEKLDSPEPKRK
jgi:hypothetical protein